MTATLTGPVKWSMDMNDEGHRTYKITHRVTTDDKWDGPETVYFTTGLPAIGSTWAYGNDTDIWAFCTPERSIKSYGQKNGEGVYYWDVTSTFSTIPMTRCNTAQIDDPLLEPQKISGGFNIYTKEITHDRNGDAILSSSHEPFRGPQMEFDHNRPTVRISQNVASLGLATFSQMVNTVNDTTLWGLAARCIKLGNVTWERKLHGICSYYYTRTFEFEVDYNTWDRQTPDMGTKVIAGEWNDTYTAYTPDSAADPDNPLDFVRAKDKLGENVRVFLDGSGAPLAGALAPPVMVDIEYYPESDFTLLGIPSSL